MGAECVEILLKCDGDQPVKVMNSFISPFMITTSVCKEWTTTFTTPSHFKTSQLPNPVLVPGHRCKPSTELTWGGRMARNNC